MNQNIPQLDIKREIDQKLRYDTPQGRYNGTVVSVFHPSSDKSILSIHVAVNLNPGIPYMAAGNYWMDGSQLLNELRNILGDDFSPGKFQDEGINYLNLEGTEVEFYIEHVCNERSKRLSACIKEFFPLAQRRLKKGARLTGKELDDLQCAISKERTKQQEMEDKARALFNESEWLLNLLRTESGQEQHIPTATEVLLWQRKLH